MFKTSIQSRDVPTVNSILRSIIPTSFWNYDLEDCDNILRIESNQHIVELVLFHLHSEGFEVEELE